MCGKHHEEESLSFFTSLPCHSSQHPLMPPQLIFTSSSSHSLPGRGRVAFIMHLTNGICHLSMTWPPKSLGPSICPATHPSIHQSSSPSVYSAICPAKHTLSMWSPSSSLPVQAMSKRQGEVKRGGQKTVKVNEGVFVCACVHMLVVVGYLRGMS